MDQDVSVVVNRPLPAVFACLADPARLSSWLMAVRDPSARGSRGPTPTTPPDAPFVLELGDQQALGEIIGHEPPRYVAYRVTTSVATHVLRITCAAEPCGATQVHVHQSGAEQLAIDLSALDRLLHG